MKILKIGMRIRIKRGSPATRISYLGYNEIMKKLEGTYQTINSIVGREVEVENSIYTWLKDDIVTIPDKKRPIELLFNPEELL